MRPLLLTRGHSDWQVNLAIHIRLSRAVVGIGGFGWARADYMAWIDISDIGLAARRVVSDYPESRPITWPMPLVVLLASMWVAPTAKRWRLTSPGGRPQREMEAQKSRGEGVPRIPVPHPWAGLAPAREMQARCPP